MKDPLDRTKVVVRHLPPSLSQSALMEQIDGRFAGRYNWFYFQPGKISQKHQPYARAYIDLKRPEYVFEFAEFFDGHVFVNEKGLQYKIVVEYAPSQRVPKPRFKKDGREGTIYKDPDYVEFLELLAKPIENLPSAEIQLERRETERAGAAKESLIVTPLMDFVRQKRAAKGGSQRLSSNGKHSRRAGGSSPGNSSSASTKRGSEKRRVPASMYVVRGISKSTSKNKSTYILVPRQEDQQLSDKSISVAAAIGTEILEAESAMGVAGATDTGKKKVLLLKGKEQEISQLSGSVSQPKSLTSPVRNSPGSITSKQSQRRETSGRMIRSILSNKEARQSQSSPAVQSEHQIQTLDLEKEKQLPRPTNMPSLLKNHLSNLSQAVCSSDCNMTRSIDDKLGNNLQGLGSISEKQQKQTRNKDKPVLGIRTPLHHLDGLNASDESLSTSSLLTEILSDSLEGMMIIAPKIFPGAPEDVDDVVEDVDSSNRLSFNSGKPRHLDTIRNSQLGGIFGGLKVDMPNSSRSGEVKILGSGRSSYSSIENGPRRHGSRRGPTHGGKDNGSVNQSEMKSSKKGVTGYGSHEKQVWVQKSGSAS